MNNLDKQYTELLSDIIQNGIKKEDRTGTGTISVFGRTIRHKMSEGFPLLTTKKMAWKGILTELIWFLRGDTNIRYLLEQKNYIWVGDAYKKYTELVKENSSKWNKWMRDNGDNALSMYTRNEFIDKILTDDEFSNKFGELGPIYGKQWRDFGSIKTKDKNTIIVKGIDQIKVLLDTLKTNPDSRRIMVNAWNPVDLPNQVLPPCHYGFQVWTRELTHDERCEWLAKKNDKNISYTDKLSEKKLDALRVPKREISLMFNMRSNDVPLGLPFNIASYALLLEIFAKMVNMVPDELIANLGDAHIYKNQIDGVKEQLTRTPMKLPNLIISDEVNFNGTINEFLESYKKDSFKLDGYESHPSIKIPLSN